METLTILTEILKILIMLLWVVLVCYWLWCKRTSMDMEKKMRMSKQYVRTLLRGGIDVIDVQDTPAYEEMDYLQLSVKVDERDCVHYSVVQEELKRREYMTITLPCVDTTYREDHILAVDFGEVVEELKRRGHTTITAYRLNTTQTEDHVTVKLLYKYEEGDNDE